jgi:hypothetical protein
MGYVVPGTERKFIPLRTSVYTPSATSDPRPVVGTVAAYQPLAAYEGVEMTAPVSVATAEDCIVQAVSGT